MLKSGMKLCSSAAKLKGGSTVTNGAGTAGSSFFQCRRAHHSSKRIGLYGACFDQGQPHEGVGEAPTIIRQAGLIDKLKQKGCLDIVDFGDIRLPREQGKMDQASVLKFNKAVAAQVEKILREDRVCLTIGGDHSVGMGTLAGHLAVDPDVVVLWVDAHADINTLASSETGHMHGMPVSFNIKQLESGNQALAGENLSWLTPSLQPSRLAYIGLRDVDPEEWEFIQKFSIPTFAMDSVDRLGIRKAVESAISIVDPLKQRKIHLSFDIDVLDPLEAPATGTKVRGGLTLREAVTLCEVVRATGRLAAIDLVEVNPALARNDSDIDATVGAAVEVIVSALQSS